MILVESEHSAMSAAIGAAAAGARVITATSSAGFALMWEMVYVAASLRLPICMALVNRALSGNINIHCDHSDAMGGRDAGWIHLFCENAQEAYDNALMAFRIGEHADVRLPVMINYDGFIISHTADSLHILDAADAGEVRRPVQGRVRAARRGEADHGRPAGPAPTTTSSTRSARSRPTSGPSASWTRSAGEYGELSGRHYDFFESYRLDDAEVALVMMGSTAGTAKDVIDDYRARGVKVGMLKLRLFRPFPARRSRRP